MADTVAFDSPIGDLEWTIISGEGKANLNGTMQYVTTLVLTAEQAEPLKELLQKYWEDNKPKSIKEAKSMGWYPHTVPTDEKDEEGKTVYAETGKVAFVFKTNVSFKDGKQKVVKVFNAKGAEVQLGQKKIGNGSRGRVNGAYGIYEVKAPNGKSIVNAGVTLYLNGIQLTKFVEYVGGPNFSEVEDPEGEGFEGFEDDGMAAIDPAAEDAPKPRL